MGILTEGVIGRGEARASTALDYRATLELGWPHRPRRLDRELWVRIVFVGLIGALTGVVLATGVQVRTVGLVGLTVLVTAIWVFTLRRAASFTQGRGTEPLIVATAGTGTGLAAVSLLDFWVLEALISPSTLLLMAASVFVLAGSFQAVVSHKLAPRRRVLVVGADDGALALIRELESLRHAQFECVGVAADRRDSLNGSVVPLLGRSSDVVEIVCRERPELVVCSSSRLRTQVVDRLLDAGVTSARVVDTPEFSELAFQRVAPRQLRSSWFTGVLDVDSRCSSACAKRAFDATFAVVALLLCAPLLLVVALLVRLSGPGPVFYRQVRSGEGGDLFQMLKFRTMVENAELGMPVWAAKNDPRVTAVGRFLRRTRLDELPQLWNVLRGEMSIVGPRPERPEYLELLRHEIPFWSRRHLLKPGITGWAQVHLAYTDNITGAASKLSYDLYYLKRRSFVLDLVILLKTFRVVLSGAGAR